MSTGAEGPEAGGPRATARSWALNLAVPLLAAGLAFAGIAHAQGTANNGGGLGPDHDCNTTLTNDTVGVLDSGVAVAPSGEVLVSESRAGCVIRFGPDGVGHDFIGHGRRTDACPRCGVRISRPGDLEVGADGTVYVVDRGEFEVVAVRPDGGTRVVAQAGDTFDSYPKALAQDSAGRIYVAETNRVYRLDPSGPVVVAGGGGGDVGSGAQATSVRLTRVNAIAVGPGGSLFIAEQTHYRVLRVDPAGAITVFAGTGLDGDSGDGGPAAKANLNPDGLAADDAGNVYISVQFQHRIRRVDTAGQITTFAGRGRTGSTGDGGPAIQAAIGFPSDLAFRDGNLYMLDSGLTPRIRKIDRVGTISTVAAGR
jgi:sugar lactone lactonase YvrE